MQKKKKSFIEKVDIDSASCNGIRTHSCSPLFYHIGLLQQANLFNSKWRQFTVRVLFPPPCYRLCVYYFDWHARKLQARSTAALQNRVRSLINDVRDVKLVRHCWRWEVSEMSPAGSPLIAAAWTHLVLELIQVFPWWRKSLIKVKRKHFPPPQVNGTSMLSSIYFNLLYFFLLLIRVPVDLDQRRKCLKPPNIRDGWYVIVCDISSKNSPR